jgi:hypothetical protein
MNVRTVLRVALPYCLVWLGFVLIPTMLGGPEVICATPFALVLTLAVGTGVVVWQRSARTFFNIVPLTWAEAVAAGTLVGAFEGLLFGVWMPVVMALREGTRVGVREFQSEEVILMAALFTPVGFLIGGLLGAGLGAIGRGFRAIGDRRRRR